MDAAEKWLYFNDPEYRVRCEGWKHIKTGHYKPPWQEIPWGDASDLEVFINATGDTPYVDSDARLCDWCEGWYYPRRSGQRFCSAYCRLGAWRETRNQ